VQGQAILHASVERKLAAGVRDTKKKTRRRQDGSFRDLELLSVI
jgi:hypothetical protein